MIAVEEGAAEVRLVKGETNPSNHRMPPKVPEPGHSEVPKAEATEGFEGKARWWFQIFIFIFTPTWGRFPF